MAIGRISGSVLKSNLTRNGVDLAFETNLLYLDVTNSRVGIGTSEPATTFHVNGTIRGSSINVNNAYTLPTSDGSAGQQLTTDGSGTVTWADKDGSSDISIAGNEIKTTTSNSSLELSANGSGSVKVAGNMAVDTDTLFVDATNDRLGIGTTSPTQALTIAGGNNAKIAFIEGGVQSLYFNDTDASLAGYFHYQHSTDQFRLNTSSSIALTGGNVGIGTTSPTSLLHVDGASKLDGVTINDNTITTNASNANLELSANSSGKVSISGILFPSSDGTANQVLATDGSGTLSFVSNSAEMEISDDTTIQILNKTGIRTTATTFDSYATGSFDSCLYYVVSRDEVNGQIATQKVLTVHNNTTPFVSTSGITRSDSTAGQSFDAAISSGTLSLQATGNANVNSLSAYKISLGDNSSAATSGNTKVIINADVDSAIENLDTFAHASHRGAKYFISVNDTTDNELEAIECMVVHNGSASKIVSYNSTRTGSTSLITLSTDISGDNVRLRGTGARANLNVKMHRILLTDSENETTGVNYKKIGATTVSSSSTALDTFNLSRAHGAFYYVVAHNSSESESSISEVSVVSDGTDAYVSTGPIVSTKGTDQLTFTAALSGDIVTLSAASSSGGSTTVNAYRINLKREVSSPGTDVLTESSTPTITGHYTFNDSIEIRLGSDADANIKHTGTNLNVNETTGDINIRTYANDKDVVISTDDGSGGITEYIVADGSTGAVKLKHYGTTVFETTTTGASITNTSTDDALLVTTTEDSSSAGPVISLKRNSSSPADADYIGQIKFKGENDNDQEVNYAKISGKILDASDGSEDGILEFAFMKNGSQNISGRFRSDSLQLLNDTSLRVTGHVELGVLSGDPSTSSNLAQIYAKDDSSSAEVFVQDEAGNVTKISPHNEKGEWEYFSRNKKTGKTVRVNMEEMIKDIEKLTGKKYIKEE